MALRRTDLAKRLFHLPTARPISPLLRRHYVSSPDTASRGFFQRFLQRRAINQASSSSPAPTRLPPFLAMPLGESLWKPAEAVENVRKIVRLAQVEMVKERLRSSEEPTLPYDEYVRICVDACRSHTQGIELAKILDDSANVVVWGNVVFLRPKQLAKSMESLLWQTAGGLPSGLRREELELMEEQKAEIDMQAQSLVRKELYFGLGLFVAQNAGFMRLTFWELSWDVMEPICFFVTTIHFALAYVFFLRTSTEPSFEGYFKRRFKAKQVQLMKARNFDVDKYERLRKAFYVPTGGFCRG